MDLEKLNRIQQVDAPPYLFTRISQRIKNAQVEPVSKRLIWAMSLSFVLMLSLNIGAVLSSGQSEDAASALVQEMNLSADNYLYR